MQATSITAARAVVPVARRCNTPAAPKRASVVPRAAAAEEVQPSVTAVSSNGAGKTSALDFDELTELIKMVHSTDIVELELNAKKFKLSVKKKEALETPEPHFIQVPGPAAYAAPPMAPPQPLAAPPPPATPAAQPAAAPAPAPVAAAVEGVEVTSPMAGTFYRSPAPGEPAFVKEGDHVTKGQNICIIEAMKLMNEIEADATGTVIKIVAENGKPVVPGQVLMIIRP